MQKKFFSNQSEILKNLIEKSDVISFDVFDTLLIRNFSNPSDVFLFIERENGIIGFHDERIKAEKKAREKSYNKTGSYEVNLSDIYNEIKISEMKENKFKISELEKIEIDTEKKFLTRSPIAGEVYDLARVMGKKIIAVSDMYLPSKIISEILEKNNLSISKIFVSCEYNASKHEGDLYEIVSKEMGVKPSSILHFGDNFKSDCESALKSGVCGYYLPSLYDQVLRDARYNQSAISKLCLNNHEKNGTEKNLFSSAIISYLARFKAQNPQSLMSEQFGAMYAGPLVCGFAAWMNVMMKSDNVKHLRLITRDGYITKEIWDRLGFSENASIMQSSRRLTVMPAIYTAFDKEISSIISSNTSCTLRECIERLSLGDGVKEFIETLGKLTPLDRPIDTVAKTSSVMKALKDCETILKKIAQSEMESYKTYLKEEGFDPFHDAIADCGWALSSQRRTEQMIGEKIRGYYVGTLEHAYMHEKINSFLFHKGKDKAWIKIAERSIELLELPFSSMENQVCRFEKKNNGVEPVFFKNEPQYEFVRTVFIQQMQDQILKFSDFIKPVIGHITIDEFREGLFILFDSLVNHPTSYEFHELAVLPHNRELGASGFSTIGTFWTTENNFFSNNSHKTKIGDYIRLGYISLNQNGFLTTFLRAKRVIRRKFVGFLDRTKGN